MFTSKAMSLFKKELEKKGFKGENEELIELLNRTEFESNIDLYFNKMGVENGYMDKKTTNEFILFLRKLYKRYNSGNFNFSSGQISSISFYDRKTKLAVFIDGIRKENSVINERHLFKIIFIYKKKNEIRREYIINLKNGNIEIKTY